LSDTINSKELRIEDMTPEQLAESIEGFEGALKTAQSTFEANVTGIDKVLAVAEGYDAPTRLHFLIEGALPTLVEATIATKAIILDAVEEAAYRSAEVIGVSREEVDADLEVEKALRTIPVLPEGRA
jgi:hypothetical protein